MNDMTIQHKGAVEAPTLADLAKALRWDASRVIQRQQEQKWVVQDFIGAGSIAWLYGAPGSYKSFAAVDIAMCVATGRPWMGREVDKGLVLYVAAEGGDDLHIRRAAWAERYGMDGPMKIVEMRPQLDEVRRDSDGDTVRPGADLLEEELREMRKSVIRAWADMLPPCAERAEIERKMAEIRSGEAPRTQRSPIVGYRALLDEREDLVIQQLEDAGIDPCCTIKLVIIDTFSQTAADDTKDCVNRYTAALRDLAGVDGETAFLVIDHTTKGGDSWMGSQAKMGNVDMMAACESKGDVLTISMGGGRGKIKAAPPFRDIHLKLERQTLDAQDAYGRTIASLVCTDGARAKRLAELADGSTSSAVLLGLVEAAEGSITRDELREAFGAHQSNEGKKADTVSRTFRRCVRDLVDDELITESEEEVISMV
jgi:hypothetical protein